MTDSIPPYTTTSFQLRIATSSDVDSISQLAERIWLKHYTAIIGTAQIDYMLNLFYSATALHEQIQEGQVFHLIYSEDHLIGYVAVSKKAEGDYFLNKFYIDQSHQGKGLGKAVFKAIISEYSQLKTLRLTVNRKNYTSINFYFRLGFLIEKVEDFDIGNGYLMEDFVMKWSR